MTQSFELKGFFILAICSEILSVQHWPNPSIIEVSNKTDTDLEWMWITPQQPSHQIAGIEKENIIFYLAELSLLSQNSCFLKKKNVNVQWMIAVACGIFEKFGWQEHFNPRASIIHMQSLLHFFLKETEEVTDFQLPCFTFVSKKGLPTQYFLTSFSYF